MVETEKGMLWASALGDIGIEFCRILSILLWRFVKTQLHCLVVAAEGRRPGLYLFQGRRDKAWWDRESLNHGLQALTDCCTRALIEKVACNE